MLRSYTLLTKWPCLLILFFLLTHLIPTTFSCGMAVHTEVVYRGLAQYRRIAAGDHDLLKFADYLEENPEFLQAGSFFPDWGYACKEWGFEDYSDDAHWPNFTRVAAEYVKETYPEPYSPHAQSLLAFLFAATSHNVADVLWHSLGFDDGLIQILADTNHRRTYASAHSAADNGGEVALRRMRQLKYEVERWKIPIRDLREIYRRYVGLIDPRLMLHCVWRGYLGKTVLRKLSQYNWFYSFIAKTSPYFLDTFSTNRRGGLQDMSAHTALCWTNLGLYFNNSFDIRRNLLCDAYDGRHRSNLTGRFGDLPFPYPLPLPVNDTEGSELDEVARIFGIDIELGEEDDDGVVTLGMSAHLEMNEIDEKKLESLLMGTWPDREVNDTEKKKKKKKKETRHSNCKPITDYGSKFMRITTNCPYAALGHSMVVGDFNNDSISDLAISAPFFTPLKSGTKAEGPKPHAGAVFIVEGGKDVVGDDVEVRDILEVATKILTGEEERMGRFGWAMAVVDLNCDGIDDLAVSAPTYTAISNATSTIIQKGKVYVYFGHAGIGLSTDPDITIELHPPNATAWDKHRRSFNDTGLGTTLHGHDVDDDGCKDLLIGWPMMSVKNYTFENSTHWPWNIRMQQTGSVVAFLSSRRHSGEMSPFDADWRLDAPGEVAYEWFGTSIELLPPSTLLIGAPGWSTPMESMAVGRIYGYNLSGNGTSGSAPSLLFDLSGTDDYQMFGREISIVPPGEAERVAEMEGIAVISGSTETRHILPNFGSPLSYLLTQLPLLSTAHNYASTVGPALVRTLWQAGTARFLSVPVLLRKAASRARVALAKPSASFSLSDWDIIRGRDAAIRGSIEGDENGAHLGKVIFAAANGVDAAEIWMSAPLTEEDSGRVYTTSLPQTLGSTNIGGRFNIDQPGVKCWYWPYGERSRFGHVVTPVDLNGDGQSDVAISAIHTLDELQGSVIIVIKPTEPE